MFLVPDSPGPPASPEGPPLDDWEAGWYWGEDEGTGLSGIRCGGSIEDRDSDASTFARRAGEAIDAAHLSRRVE